MSKLMHGSRPVVRDGRHYFTYECDVCYGMGHLSPTIGTFCGTCPGCGGMGYIVRRPTPSGTEYLYENGKFASARLKKIFY